MEGRMFPQPFRMTIANIQALESQQTTPVGKVQNLIFMASSFIIDLAFLPPSVAESIIRGEKLRLPGG
jgi:hypothetical protein